MITSVTANYAIFKYLRTHTHAEVGKLLTS